MMTNSNPTLLVVDDEELLCQLMADELREARYTVLTARSGIEALAVLSKNRVDAIVSDVRMPGMDGLTMLKQLRLADPVLPPVVFVSGFSEMDPRDAYANGASAIFSKPIDYDELLATLKRLLGPEEERFIRKSARADVRASVTMTLGSHKDARTAKVLNVGRGGFALAIAGSGPDVGEEIDFDLEFQHNSQRLKGKGICRWKSKEGSKPEDVTLGVEFIELEEESQKFLTYLMHQSPTKSFIPAK